MAVSWHGVTLDARTAAMMDAVQALVDASPAPFTITPTQGSYSTSVGASFGTHAGGGAIDIAAASLSGPQRDFLVAAMRQVGFAAWLRTPAQGFPYHVHGIAVGCLDLSSQAATQVQAYLAGRNGLADNGADDGPRDWVGVTWETYSGGTYVPPSGGDPVSMYDQYPGDMAGAFTDPLGHLAGSPSITGTGIWDVANIGSTVTTLHLDAGDSTVLGGVLGDWSYTLPDDLARGYWMLRVEDVGTITVEAGYGAGHTWPNSTTGWAELTYAGTDGTFRYWQLAEDLSPAHFTDGDLLLRVTCVSGSVDITWAGVRVEGVAGFYTPDGGAVWSAVQPFGSRAVPFDEIDGTWATYDDGGTLKYVTDEQPVQFWDPSTYVAGSGVVQTNDRDDVAQPRAAIELAIDDKHETSGTAALAGYNAQPEPVISLFPPFYTYTAVIQDARSVSAAPSRSALPVIPAGLPGIVADWEWMDDDTSFLGWRWFAAKVVETAGDGPQLASPVIQVTRPTPGDCEFILSIGTRDDAPGLGDWDDGTEVATTRSADVALPQIDLETDEQVATWTLAALPIEAGQEDAQLALRYSHVFDAGVEYFAAEPVVPVFRVPSWRYSSPTFTSGPTPAPIIDFDEDPQITYLRNKPRNDGLGAWSSPRSRGATSVQRSNRARGYR